MEFVELSRLSQNRILRPVPEWDLVELLLQILKSGSLDLVLHYITNIESLAHCCADLDESRTPVGKIRVWRQSSVVAVVTIVVRQKKDLGSRRMNSPDIPLDLFNVPPRLQILVNLLVKQPPLFIGERTSQRSDVN